MVRLTRSVRFGVSPTGEPGGLAAVDPGARNGYAGVPAVVGLGAHYELDVTCRGEVDPNTGYFLDIKAVDRATASTAIPAIARAAARQWGSGVGVGGGGALGPGSVLAGAMPALDAAVNGTLIGVRWWITPFYSVEVVMSQLKSDRACALVRQRFEFAAAHRLHTDTLSPEENRRLFGKCNHPSGHGHNYIVEPAVRVPLSGEGSAFTLVDLERAVAETVLARFDHTFLNLDAPEFRSPGGVNPSVENIARVCFELLRAPVEARPGVSLQAVTVWETEKTSATYPG